MTMMDVDGMATPVVTLKLRDAGGKAGETTMTTAVVRVRVPVRMMTIGDLRPTAIAMTGAASHPTTDRHLVRAAMTMTTVAPPPGRDPGAGTPKARAIAGTSQRRRGTRPAFYNLKPTLQSQKRCRDRVSEHFWRSIAAAVVAYRRSFSRCR